METGTKTMLIIIFSVGGGIIILKLLACIWGCKNKCGRGWEGAEGVDTIPGKSSRCAGLGDLAYCIICLPCKMQGNNY